MSHQAVPTAPRGHGRAWFVLAVLLTAVAAACLTMWADQLSGSPAVKAAPPPSATPAADGREAQAKTRTSSSRPVRLTIPAIGVSTSLVRLGMHPDRTVEVPSDPDRAGWFRLGPPPGGIGSSVILGHVDSSAGPAVFADLEDLEPGRQVSVLSADGSTVRFRVVSVATYPNADFPAQKVYGRLDAARLNLVTCGGIYDRSKGGYQSNVVVYTRRLGHASS